MTQTIDIKKTINEVNYYASSLNLKTYKVMYYFGAWISKETFAAESDAEAIFDADMIVATAPARGKLTYALWQGNRRVKTY
jgi:hypothetical protein